MEDHIPPHRHCLNRVAGYDNTEQRVFLYCCNDLPVKQIFEDAVNFSNAHYAFLGQIQCIAIFDSKGDRIGLKHL